MSDKFDIEGAANIIADEGIGYAVQSYATGDQFEDKRLGTLWENARNALNALEKYVDKKMEEIYGNEI